VFVGSIEGDTVGVGLGIICEHDEHANIMASKIAVIYSTFFMKYLLGIQEYINIIGFL